MEQEGNPREGDALHSSPLLKKTSIRQIVLDKWLPLNKGAAVDQEGNPRTVSSHK